MNLSKPLANHCFGLLIECVYLRQFISICGISMELNRIQLCPIYEHQLWGNNINNQIEITKGNSLFIFCFCAKPLKCVLHKSTPFNRIHSAFIHKMFHFHCNNCFMVRGKSIWYFCAQRMLSELWYFLIYNSVFSIQKILYLFYRFIRG